MNNAVVLFLDSVDKVNLVVESGVVIQGTFTPVLSLVKPAKKGITNVPPFIRNEVLAKELSRNGQLVPLIKLIPLGCVTTWLKAGDKKGGHTLSYIAKHSFLFFKLTKHD